MFYRTCTMGFLFFVVVVVVVLTWSTLGRPGSREVNAFSCNAMF